MIVTKSINVGTFLKSTTITLLLIVSYNIAIALLYHFELIKLIIPRTPVAIIGTAVAFYVGFKNNQAYNRMWEARKIWGGIVNESRTWGIMVETYISNLFKDEKITKEKLYEIKKRLIYRHIAWLYAHRSQLLVPTPWEHISQDGKVKKMAEYYQKNFGIGLVDDEISKMELKHYLLEKEYKELPEYSNIATQIIKKQSLDLQELREQNMMDDFRHTKMVEVLQNFYTLQGKNERIKKFPLPRQYAVMSRYFVEILIFLLPFSIIPELTTTEMSIWLSVPISCLISWVYMMMELVGDYSENPFQGMANDIPMLSLCRTIEIDLREMINDEDIPEPIESKNGVLM